MELILYMLAKTVEIYLGLASLAMLVRVILQLFATEHNKILAICYLISEPIVMPFRLLFSKLNIGQNMPIDISFFVAYLSLAILQMFLPSLQPPIL